MEHFTIRDFSGGLNTSMDEANLPSNMTASILNVDFLDSKALKRRNGFSYITATPLNSAAPVYALYRYYKKAGTKYWVAVCGTALYTIQSAGTPAPVTRIEAESAFSSGAGWETTTYMTTWSGGAAKYGDELTASANFLVPKSTSITMGLYLAGSEPLFPPKIKVKIGATSYPTISATLGTVFTRTYTGLAATAHVVSLSGSFDAGQCTVAADYFDYSEAASSTKILTTLTASSRQFAFATLDDNCYFSSAYDQLSKFNGSTVTAITATNTPSCAFLAVKGRRMFGAGSATDPSKLYYSELDDAEDWGKSGTQNGIYVAGQDAGGTCTGLAVANDLLYFFSQSRTYALDTRGLPANWESRCLSESHGCVAPNSIAVAPNGVIFLAADGVRAHGTVQGIYSDDGSAFTILSDNITPTLNAYTDVEKAAAVGIVYKNRYWLAIGSDVLVCDLEKRTENNQPPWTKYDAHDVNCFAVTRSDEYGLYSGSRTSGHIYRLDYGGTDNGSAISLLYKTPPLAPKGYTTVKHYRHTYIAAESPQAQSVSVEVRSDDVSSAVQTVAFSADTDIQPKRIETPARGRSAQVRISSDGSGQSLTISELTMTYNPRPKVR